VVAGCPPLGSKNWTKPDLKTLIPNFIKKHVVSLLHEGEKVISHVCIQKMRMTLVRLVWRYHTANFIIPSPLSKASFRYSKNLADIFWDVPILEQEQHIVL